MKSNNDEGFQNAAEIMFHVFLSPTIRLLINYFIYLMFMLFWVVTQRWLVVSYWFLGQPIVPIFENQACS